MGGSHVAQQLVKVVTAFRHNVVRKTQHMIRDAP